MAAENRELIECQTPCVRTCIVSLTSHQHLLHVGLLSTLQMSVGGSEGEVTGPGSTVVLWFELTLVWLCALSSTLRESPQGGPSLLGE